MRITIGDVANELMPYASTVELNLVHQIPFIRAPLTTASGVARCYMYVIQSSSDIYTACDTYDEISGCRLFPMGPISAPFMSEQELIIRWLGHKHVIESYKPGIVKKDMTYAAFMKYMYGVLMNRRIVKPTSNQLERPISSLNFANEKILEAIEKGFGRDYQGNRTISALMEWVNVQRKPFVIDGLRPKDIHCVRGKLRDIGVIVTLTENVIDHITLKRL